uniref:Uncharacterized protein n=1 Tax=Odontella aurita TaxID=265563 RepID=A0A7S4N787_9STRA
MKMSRSDPQDCNASVPSLFHCVRLRFKKRSSNVYSTLLSKKLFNFTLNIRGYTSFPFWGDKILAVKVPSRVRASRGIPHRPPHLWRTIANYATKLHDNAITWEVLCLGKGHDLGIRAKLLATKFLTGKGQYGKLTIIKLFTQRFESLILAPG